MTKREYLKHNNPKAFDIKGKSVKPGDTVIINNNYSSTPYIGVVDHFTETGNLAISYGWLSHCGGVPHIIKSWAYRPANKVIKIKSGRKSRSKNQG